MSKNRYRRLDLDELKELEPEFINFLAVNGIEASEWEQIKAEDTAKMNEFVDMFSDMVFDKILSEIEYLNFSADGKFYYFKCDDDILRLIVIEMESEESEYASIYSAEKEYTKERKTELFDMLQMGCEISDGAQYKQAEENLNDGPGRKSDWQEIPAFQNI